MHLETQHTDYTPLIVHQDLLQIASYPAQGMYSQVLLRSQHCTYTLLGLSKGNYIDLHRSSGNIAIQVINGSGVLELQDKTIPLRAGMFLFIPAHVTQGLGADENLGVLHCLIHE